MPVECTVRAAGTADVNQLSRALADAFEDDPVWAWALPERDGRHARLLRFYRYELQKLVLPAGRALTNQSGDGACLELPTEGWRVSIGQQLLSAVTFLRIFGRRLGEASQLAAEMDRRHPTEPHYYIAYVGVAPGAQGQGLGEALMAPTLERCDTEGLPAYLEATNERNAALYQRLGFQHLESFSVLESPPLWAMRRPPN
jgi:ribosomal protein S18 acetylase RimI-like enzyme